MNPSAKRRFIGLLTVLLFAISSVAHVYAATEAVMKMSPAAMQMQAGDHGMDCGGGDHKASKIDCLSVCATSVAILSEFCDTPFSVAMLDVTTEAFLPLPSYGWSPDPYPPKQ